MNLDFRSDVLLEASHRFEATCHPWSACSACTYAQLFAVQPRALCVHPTAALKGRVLYAGQPACIDAVLHTDDLRLSVYLAQAKADLTDAVVPACAA